MSLSSDLDPLFLKALKLLQSKNKESADQIKELLDEILAQRKKQKEIDNITEEKDRNDEKLLSKKVATKHGGKKETEKKELEKRQLDQLQRDLAELSQESVPHKRIKVEHPSPSPRREDESKYIGDSDDGDEDVEIKTEADNRQQTRSAANESESSSDSEVESTLTRIEEAVERSPTDMNAFVMDQGLACVICKSFGVTSSNQLVECQECHSLYHQDCHSPQVVAKNVNDPRFVWYCSQCTKTMKKSVPKPPPKPKQVVPVLKDNTVQKMPPSKSDSNLLLLQPFKRAETTKISSSKDNSQSAGWPMGLAGLAEKLNSKGAAVTESSKQAKPIDARSMSSEKSKPSALLSSSSKPSSAVDPTGLGALFKPDPVKVVSAKTTVATQQVARSHSVSSAPSSSSLSVKAISSSSLKITTTGGQLRTLGQTTTAAGSKSQSTTVSSSAEKRHQTTTVADAADKRLQMMKKKAAAVAQEKKNLIK